ncbi:MAG: hypothetical protein M1839_004122 [Geoglossum umbratile]|nr:MAG: hypothetical protein M1839_004122 [Geoglossum umbratile]
MEIEKYGAKNREGSPHTVVAFLNSRSSVFAGVLRETNMLLEKHWSISFEALELVSLNTESCYLSSFREIGGDLCLEICYNARESLAYHSPVADDPDDLKSIDIILDHHAEPCYSRYNLKTGQTTFVILDSQPSFRTQVSALEEAVKSPSPRLHPFTLHIAVIFHALSLGTSRMENVLKRLLAIEKRLLEGSLFEITESDQFSKYTQILHEMSRSLITLESRTERIVANIENLLSDHEKILKVVSAGNGKGMFPLDLKAHERIGDGLRCLKDRCFDRARRARNLKQRVQNFITLLYNLMASRDSLTNIRIAVQSTKIAQETRRDSFSMKTIAVVTMLYLPATFVSSVFGTNFFAATGDGLGLTTITLGVWVWAVRGGRERRREEE